MDANERGQLSSDLMRGCARFQAWRQRRALGQRIPQPLWALAVQLTKTHGICRTATALGLDYYSLKKRAASGPTPPQSSEPVFVEVAPPVRVAKQCRLELDNRSGTTMRVELVGYDAADIEALASGIWNAL